MGVRFAFGIVGALSSICHPEERCDEGSAVASWPVSDTTPKVGRSPIVHLHRKAEKATADPSLRSG